MTMSESTTFAGHDHDTCISSALDAAQKRCAQEGLRFTDIRRRVLELLLQEHRALGAYELLDMLAKEGHARQPPVIYRALHFLTEHGFAHKIARLNAYVACSHSSIDHEPLFLICSECNAVAESQAPVAGVLKQAAAAADFAIVSTAMEAEGICPACRPNSATPA